VSAELGEQLAKTGHAPFAQPPRPFLLELGDDPEGGADFVPAAFSEADQDGPAGLEEFFREWGTRPLDVEAMTQALAPYGVELVGPPPPPSG
jgi:hypothetical protein